MWADIQPVPVPVTAYAYSVAFGPDGRRALGGLTSAAASQPTDALILAERDQVRGYCFGDGQIAACPCGNNAPAGEGQGCANSSGDAARLTGAGDASLVADTDVLTVRGVPQNAISLFVQGSAATAPAAFGDGLRCVGQNLKRMYLHGAPAGVVSAPDVNEPTLSARSAALGDPVAAGTQRYYQVYYRDARAGFCSAPAGSSFNVSNAVSILWGQ